jgi:hypothetical protein
MYDIIQSFKRFFDRGVVVKAMNLVKIDVIGAKAAQAVVDRMKNVLAREALLVGIVPHRLKTLVAMTTRSRDGPNSFSARPVTSSLAPTEYISAVSKKLMPDSNARRKKGLLSSSSSTHSRHFFEPYVMVPRQIRETLSPVEPRFTYCMLPPAARSKVRIVCFG